MSVCDYDLTLTTEPVEIDLQVTTDAIDLAVTVQEILIEPLITTVDIEPSVTLVEIAQIGAQGPPGPAGTSGMVVTLTAGQTLSGHRVVATQADGTVLYASNDTLTDATRQLWVTLGAAIEGDGVQCQSFGRVYEGGWSWTDDPIFLGQNGVLTQTPPSLPDAAFFLQVAVSDGPSALVFNPRNPFQL